MSHGEPRTSRGHQAPPPGSQVFVDESKRDAFYLAAAVIAPAHVAALRSTMRTFLLPGQSRLHFTKERPARRKPILTEICTSGVEVRMYVARSYRHELEARRACLEQLVVDAADVRASRILLERDDSLVSHDDRVLFHAVRKAGVEHEMTYSHLRAPEEPLLWIADAAAWSWTSGGAWRERIEPAIGAVITV